MSDNEYEVNVDYANTPKGEEIHILGLGAFENGKRTKVDQDTFDGYKRYWGSMPPRIDPETLEELPLLDPIAAFKDDPHVTVEKVQTKSRSDKNDGGNS
ncbi:MAG TPA: hypothetical protein VM715_04690 [Candidatus Acidoferrum sp.]|nr:hypothetical protein [Candidatus Acidoferrum sp.]